MSPTRIFTAATLLAATLSHASAPTPENRAQATELKAAGEALAPRIKQLAAQLTAANPELDAAAKKRPSPDEMAAMTKRYEGTEADRRALEADCDALKNRMQPLRDGFIGADSYCRNGSSYYTAAECADWRKLGELFAPLDACYRATEEEGRVRYRWHQFESGWKKEQEKLDEIAAAESAFKQPVSGSPRQRAIVVPPSLVTYDEKAPIGRRRQIDTFRLFADAHPSRFVFLRKNVSGAPENSGESEATFSRTLKKGEAVLALQATCSENEVRILSIDGNDGIVKVSDLAVAPLPGTKPVALTADDLEVVDAKGKVIAGPNWLVADTTGFWLDEPAGWLELLEPPEPRSQRFSDAKEKVLGCYTAQMDKLDPSGKLRARYDVVTYGRGGVVSVESAESNFDRKACAACNCKAFNELKRKLVKEAMAPAQKKRFETYQPMLEKLKKADFTNAAKGAPKGDDAWGSTGPF